jgi:thioredoxin reductase (NADPH)
MSHYLIEQLEAKPNIVILLGAEVGAAHGDDNLTAVEIRDTRGGAVTRHASGWLFVFIGARAETEWLPGAIARDANGYVLTGDDLVRAGSWTETRDPYLLESSVPGIFACGDVRLSPIKRVAAAVGEGSMAIALVHQYLRQAGRA